jgi:hypothetical protein
METLPVERWLVNVIDHFLPRQLLTQSRVRQEVGKE